MDNKSKNNIQILYLFIMFMKIFVYNTQYMSTFFVKSINFQNLLYINPHILNAHISLYKKKYNKMCSRDQMYKFETTQAEKIMSKNI